MSSANPVNPFQSSVRTPTQNISQLLGMIRNRTSQSDQRHICRQALSMTGNDPNSAINLLKEAYRMAGAGSVSESLKGSLFQEANEIRFSRAPNVGLEFRSMRLREEVNTYMNSFVQRGLFNGTVLVMNPSKNECFMNAYGKLVSGESIGMDTPMPIGSCTKQLTAGGVMVLQAMGLLLPSDTVKQHLPDFPYENITIEDLLIHHSGIQDSDPKASQKTVTDRKGTFSYSNRGYQILSELTVVVAEKNNLIGNSNLDGSSWNDFMKAYVFEPLGMTNTYCMTEKGKKVWGFEAPSNKNAPVLSGPTDLSETIGSGNGLTSIKDWRNWNLFLCGQIEWHKEGMDTEQDSKVSRQMKEMAKHMTKVHAIHSENNNQIGHGYGLRIESLKGQTMIRHGGLNIGILSESRLYEDGTIVAVITNVEDAPLPTCIVPDLKKLSNQESSGKELASPIFPKAVAPDTQNYSNFLGKYQLSSREYPYLEVTTKDDKLFVQVFHPYRQNPELEEMHPVSDHEFFIKQGMQKLNFSTDGSRKMAFTGSIDMLEYTKREEQ